MDDKILITLEQRHERAPRSKLEPHAEVIRQLRRKGRTYQEISRLLLSCLVTLRKCVTIHKSSERGARGHVDLKSAEQCLLELTGNVAAFVCSY